MILGELRATEQASQYANQRYTTFISNEDMKPDPKFTKVGLPRNFQWIADEACDMKNLGYCKGLLLDSNILNFGEACIFLS